VLFRNLVLPRLEQAFRFKYTSMTVRMMHVVLMVVKFAGVLGAVHKSDI
jgi:hypothetical protein